MWCPLRYVRGLPCRKAALGGDLCVTVFSGDLCVTVWSAFDVTGPTQYMYTYHAWSMSRHVCCGVPLACAVARPRDVGSYGALEAARLLLGCTRWPPSRLCVGSCFMLKDPFDLDLTKVEFAEHRSDQSIAQRRIWRHLAIEIRNEEAAYQQIESFVTSMKEDPSDTSPKFHP